MATDPVGCLEWTPTVGNDLAVRVSGRSHVGLVRDHNEDAWSAEPPVFVVADGMGGHDAGDAASRGVIEAFAEMSIVGQVSVEDLDRCVRRAKELVDELAGGDRGAPGSTVVAAAYTEQDGVPYWLIANVGDSRAYVWRGGSLEQVSRDHSIVQELIDAGEIDDEQARHHPERHVITRAIGAVEDAVAEYAIIPLLPGARLLLCSDGLTGEVSDEEICRVLSVTPSPDDAVEALITAALAGGGHDNVTVLLADVIGAAGDVEDTLPSSTSIGEDTLKPARR